MNPFLEPSCSTDLLALCFLFMFAFFALLFFSLLLISLWDLYAEEIEAEPYRKRHAEHYRVDVFLLNSEKDLTLGLYFGCKHMQAYFIPYP